MARAKVVHSTASTSIQVKGNRGSPEPQTTVINFPGGHVEVTRTTDDKYWVHIGFDEDAKIKDSRVDFKFEEYARRVDESRKEIREGKRHGVIPQILDYDKIQHMALLVDGIYHEPGEGDLHE